MCATEGEATRAREELVVAHRLFRRYAHKDTAWLIEFLVGEWRRALGPDQTWEISRLARIEAGRLEDSGAPLKGGIAMTQEAVAESRPYGLDSVESVVIGGDLARLEPAERVAYYRSVCESLGLNPLTKPFEYLVLNERLTLYARKDATDQLRALRGISVTIAGREFDRDAGLYVVTARAVAKDGRADESVGAVSVRGLQGENLANALMTAETKAKRRVTLSVSGLGWLDVTEVGSIGEARPVAVDAETGELLAPPERSGRVNWNAFWTEAKRLGFTPKLVHEIAGTQSLAHLDQAAIADLLELLREKAENAAAATPPDEDER